MTSKAIPECHDAPRRVQDRCTANCILQPDTFSKRTRGTRNQDGLSRCRAVPMTSGKFDCHTTNWQYFLDGPPCSLRSQSFADLAGGVNVGRRLVQGNFTPTSAGYLRDCGSLDANNCTNLSHGSPVDNYPMPNSTIPDGIPDFTVSTDSCNPL